MKFSGRQILASAAGAVLATLIASSFGVNGTIIGVAIGSVAATFGTALVAASIERGQQAVKQVAVRAPESSTLLRKLGATGASGRAASSLDTPSAPTEAAAASSGSWEETVQMASSSVPTGLTEGLEVSAAADAPAGEALEARTLPARGMSAPGAARRFSWPAIAGTAAIVFVLSLMFVTAVELIAGKPIASIFGPTEGGTTVKNIFVPSPAPTTPSSPTTTTTTSTTTTTTTAPATTTTATNTTTTAPSSGGSTTTTPGGTTTTTSGVGTTTTTAPTTSTSSAQK